MNGFLMLIDKNLKNELEEKHPWTGIYKLRCLSDDPNKYISIQRILKTDSEGVLYIGTSDYIPNRIEDLKVSITEAFANGLQSSCLQRHTCGKKFINKWIREKFPLEKLCVEIIPSDKSTNIDSHYILEGEKLLKYEEEFGEPPPFNEGRRV